MSAVSFYFLPRQKSLDSAAAAAVVSASLHDIALIVPACTHTDHDMIDIDIDTIPPRPTVNKLVKG